MTGKQTNILISVLIVAACAVVYGQTYSFDFINIDDRAYIWENPAVLSGLNSRSIAWAFGTFHSGNWHPVTWLSHMLDVELFGAWAGGHHLTNAVLHAVNSFLAFTVFRLMTGSSWKSAFVALLFAVHPAHVESVAWVAERKDVLSTVFWLLTMLAYVGYVRRYGDGSDRRRRILWMLAVSVAFALGLMAKPMLVTLPFALLLCDYWPLRRLNTLADLRPLLIEKLPLFVMTIAASVITVLAQSGAGATVSLSTVPFADRFAHASIAFGKYLLALVYPVDLGFWYPFDPAINKPSLAASVLVLLGVTFFAWKSRERHRYLLAGWLWFLGTMVPVIGIVQVGMQSHADRYTYVPYFGLFVMIAWGIGDLARRFSVDRRIIATAAAIVVVSLAALSYRQTSLWHDVERLYTHSIANTRNNYFLMSNLCLFYLRRADTATAERRCTELLEATPPSVDSLHILGYLRMEVGRYDDGVKFLQGAVQLDPNRGILHAQLSQALSKEGTPVEAELSFKRALAANDNSANAETLARTAGLLAESWFKSGRKDKAIEYLRKALELKPDYAEAKMRLENLGG